MKLDCFVIIPWMSALPILSKNNHIHTHILKSRVSWGVLTWVMNTLCNQVTDKVREWLIRVTGQVRVEKVSTDFIYSLDLPQDTGTWLYAIWGKCLNNIWFNKHPVWRGNSSLSDLTCYFPQLKTRVMWVMQFHNSLFLDVGAYNSTQGWPNNTETQWFVGTSGIPSNKSILHLWLQIFHSKVPQRCKYQCKQEISSNYEMKNNQGEWMIKAKHDLTRGRTTPTKTHMTLWK